MSALDNNPIALLKAMLPRIPMILKTALLHVFRLSPGSGKQDLRTELTVAIIRSFISFNAPVSQQQKSSMRDPGIKGRIWVSKVTLPRPEGDVQDAVIKAFEDLKAGDETYDIPGVGPVEAEWTAYRSGVDKKTPQPDISEEEKYRLLREEAQSDMVILYFHGGAYFLMDPCTHRVAVSQLSKHTGAPVLSVRYRLAPQHPFPAALVDALVAYLSLLAPPPGSFHKPVPASKIILAGDSAGGNLTLVLLQTLLTLRRVSPTIRFHGQDVRIELPAGAATISPWCDITRSMPSIFQNARYDYLDPPYQTPNTTFAPLHQTPDTTFAPLPIPKDDIWPRSPPRGDFFANANALLHPLVSPLVSRKEIWKDSPPVFMSIGEEGLTDEGLVLARKMYQVGVPVVVEQFEGMPHCFGMIMVGTPAGQRSFQGMADFCRDAVADRVKATGNLTYIGFKLRSTREIPLEEANALSDEEVDRLLRRTADWRLRGEEELQRQWTERAKL